MLTTLPDSLRSPGYWSTQAELAMALHDLLTDPAAKAVLLDTVLTCCGLAQWTKRQSAAH